MICAKNIYTLNCLYRPQKETKIERCSFHAAQFRSSNSHPHLIFFSFVFQFNLWLLRSGLIFALSTVLSCGLIAGNLELHLCLLCLHLPQVGLPPDPKPCPGQDAVLQTLQSWQRQGTSCFKDGCNNAQQMQNAGKLGVKSKCSMQLSFISLLHTVPPS